MKERRLLIVDDEKNIRLTLAQSLRSLGVEVETAVYAEEALYKLAQNDYDLVLLDLELPGMGGMEMLRRAKRTRPDVPVMIITAYGTQETSEEALSLGAVEFVQKPFSSKEIRERVSRVLNLTSPPS
ncbi:MAG: response regulator [Deltaproteobacteria bacterium]|nr:response regulator [Deltaproteobacteria bacterium]